MIERWRQIPYNSSLSVSVGKINKYNREMVFVFERVVHSPDTQPQTAVYHKYNFKEKHLITFSLLTQEAFNYFFPSNPSNHVIPTELKKHLITFSPLTHNYVIPTEPKVYPTSSPCIQANFPVLSQHNALSFSNSTGNITPFIFGLCLDSGDRCSQNGPLSVFVKKIHK